MFPALLAAAALAAAHPPAPSAASAPAVVATPTPALRADQAAALIRALDEAASHGFRRTDFVGPALDRAIRQGEVRAGEGQRQLLAAAGSYARAVRSGRLAAGAFRKEWARRPEPFDAEGELRRAIAEDRLGPWLAALPPPAPAYHALQDALVRYEAIVAAGGWPTLPAGAVVAPGGRDPRIPVLRKRLTAEGWDAAGDDGRLDPALSRSLAAFQTAHGLEANGKLDKPTLAELDISAADRVGQIRANLERRRWVARSAAPMRIEVNVAAATLDYFEDGRVVLSMATIVGKPSTPTPLFDDRVESLVFDPPWNVPTEIAAKEILPKAAKDPGYLARNDFVFLPGPGGKAMRLQQKPGPKSALGLVKFDLPNRFDVYLHDTPAHAPFARPVRALSHGCIRLDRPLELAERLLAGDPDWPPASITAAAQGGVTVRAPLQRTVPVSIAYWTVFPGPDGVLQFRRDLYGWDKALLGLVGD